MKWEVILLIVSVNASFSRIFTSNYLIPANSTQRENRFFSLFSVVRFRRSSCYGSTGYNGTCLTSVECQVNGGISTGICAAGFGVCCIFNITKCHSTSTFNNTYWQNGNYPNFYTESGHCSHFIEKMSSNICQIRLDFIKFVTAGPDSNSGTRTECRTDLFTVSGANHNVPVICGTNSGQHIYLNLDTDVSSVSLNLILTGTATSRTWNIQIAQIPCFTSYSAPDGCLQWYTEVMATFSSFNYQFSTTPSVQHLANQDYTICIRAEDDKCGIAYEVCDTAVTDSLAQFAISGESSGSVVDANCLTDFVQIPCANDQRSAGSQLSSGVGCVGKICGNAFSALSGASSPAVVYSTITILLKMRL